MLLKHDHVIFDFGNDITSDSVLVLTVDTDHDTQKTTALVRLCQSPAIDETIVLWEGEGYDVQWNEEILEQKIREHYKIAVNQNLLNPN